ncbi:MAG: glutamine-hydrolyzing GMP synthase, partial [Bacteriovoracaceae bacterium]
MSDVWIVDFGSQYTQLITRKARELGYSSLIVTVDEAFGRLKRQEKPLAFILSGGPHSVFDDETDYGLIFESGRPLLGICYGMQLVGQYYKGKVEKGEVGEYGHSTVHSEGGFSFPGMPASFTVWMSHADHLTSLPQGFSAILKSNNGLIAGIESQEKKIMALQFHPEVNHTEFGKETLKHFFHEVARVKTNWSNQVMLENCLEEVREVKGSKVLCAFSGGVDSLVAATIAHKELGEDLYCFFVDNGLLRPQDYRHIELLKKETGLNIEIIDAKEDF